MKIETKYSIGNVVYTLYNEGVYKVEVISVSVNVDNNNRELKTYTLKSLWSNDFGYSEDNSFKFGGIKSYEIMKHESKLFTTKEDLIRSLTENL